MQKIKKLILGGLAIVGAAFLFSKYLEVKNDKKVEEVENLSFELTEEELYGDASPDEAQNYVQLNREHKEDN